MLSIDVDPALLGVTLIDEDPRVRQTGGPTNLTVNVLCAGAAF